MFSNSEIRDIYNKRAGFYDFSANLYYLFGFRENAYRKQAIKQLELKPGDTIVEVGCGTGLNFWHYQQYIGQSGKIIGIDLTANMLKVARTRCEKHNWHNVELVEMDAVNYSMPRRVDAVFSSFALTLMPGYRDIITRIFHALGRDKKFVLLDLKLPDWPLPLVKIMLALTRPFAVTEDLAKRHPWEDMQQVFGNLRMQEFFWGGAYIAESVKDSDAK